MICVGLKNGQVCILNHDFNSTGSKNAAECHRIYSKISDSHRMGVNEVKWTPNELKVILKLLK